VSVAAKSIAAALDHRRSADAERGRAALVVRILVDQSSYDLLNIGDVAMLQSCIARLRSQWPDAEIMVIAHEPARLASYCPGTIAIGRTFADRWPVRIFPKKLRLMLDQAWKMAAPYLPGRPRAGNSPGGPRTAIQAVREADLVVASGGGYLTDLWWWHAVGVLSLLALAQRLGKPTAMFGQGIGPVRRRALRAQARGVAPGLAVFGLRDDRDDAAVSLGAPAAMVCLTGDDAFELAVAQDVADGGSLGVNVRVARYAGVDETTAARVGEGVLAIAAELGAPLIGLPVSRYRADADLAALRSLLRPADARAGLTLDDLTSPQQLISAVARCRAIVTGSYHVAVFGLAQGVPVVCLTKSSYYDAKFAGLRAMFPRACFVVPLGGPEEAAGLRSAVQAAWNLPVPERATARDTSGRLREAGREAYARFRAAVDRPGAVPPSRQGAVL
jgi:polysaccharide pyruvyl transferase WcaK-like protein